MADEKSTDSQQADTTNSTEDMNAALLAEDTKAESTESNDEQRSESEEKVETEESESESENSDESEYNIQDSSEDSETEESEKAEEPTDDPKELARRAYKQREDARKTRAQEQQKQQEQLNEYVNEAENDQEKALRQLQVESYTTRIQANTDRLVNSYEKAVSQIELFQNPTPEVKRMLDKAIDNFQALNVQIDANGNPYQVNGDLYQYLQSEAADIEALTQNGARQENKNRAKSRANAMTPPARAKPTPKVDPVMAELLKDD